MKLFLAIIVLSFGGFSYAADKQEQRKPASKEGFIGSVEVSYTSVGGTLTSHQIIQIVDRTAGVICYGKVGTDSSTISCLPIKNY